jgi:hypothetical protein
MKAAGDPNMMKEVERMAQLTPKERLQLQTIQEGLQGMNNIYIYIYTYINLCIYH